MLFNGDRRIFESYKERNLYYKFFAGYFFNELIPGYNIRLKSFSRMIVKSLGKTRSIDPVEIELSPDSTYVSFDNHVVQFEAKRMKKDASIDRGEFADVLIRDLRHRILIAIEVKYKSRVAPKKDLTRNWDRILQANRHLKAKTVVQCLLVTNAEAIHLSSKEPAHSLSYLTWRELLNETENKEVRNWLRRQLKEVAR